MTPSLITPTILHNNPDLPTSHDSAVIGVDEVGRGCLFGHMTVAAVLLPAYLTTALDNEQKVMLTDTAFAKLTDSKKLSAKQRVTLATHIKQTASYAIVDVSATLIDKLNIHNATLLGMKSAIQALIQAHTLSHATVLIDGNYAPKLDVGFLAHTLTTLTKGDARHSSIACASILAKVHRDTQMCDYANAYPDYAFDKHKGYPTKAHLDALHTHGVLAEHRKSFTPVAALLPF
ncbi:MAG: ribonuclease HII [Moraxella sp.]|nr:ribonuclease HII [Moraxella sp.]